MSLELDYYYGKEAEQYSFYRIPKVLFSDARFKQVSVEAKVLYGLLLDRMALSVKNNWLDADGRVYIIYTISDVMETLGCAEQKVNKLLSELDNAKGVGLIERKRRGLGKPNVIYVKNFLDKSQIQKCENHNSGNADIANQEMRKSQTSNTDLSETDGNDTESSIHPTEPETAIEEKRPHTQKRTDRMDEMESYREIIQENISYAQLLLDYPYDRERLDGYVELLVETVCSRRKTIRLNQEDMPAEVVKSRLLKLDGEHIRYVLDCLNRNTTQVGNIKAYTLSCLYNAPVTIDQYYTSLTSHDMAKSRDSS